MPKPQRSLTWGQILEGAKRLDARHDTEAYSTAVLCAMLARACEKKAAPKKVYFLVRRPRVAPMTPKQEAMAWRRKMAYS
ncbi:hypothetical protein [Variovorax sp. YR566]|uniref:hypothetical protein n=1 Tax=Variovorax sp. YR566 TaxID=3450237 RepID=UPI003F816802